MENVKIKIPDQHYLGMIKRSDDDLPLGFLTPYGTDSASKKRMATVDSWVGHNQKKIEPKTLDNVPLVGFRLSETIRRVSNWGKGNVAWRIEDPRGFELEITNNNLMHIMLCTLIFNGEILSPCIWGREGAENILIPTDSNLYKNAVINTNRQKSSIPTKSLQPGNQILLKNGNVGKYLGSFYGIFANSHKLGVSFSTSKRHAVLLPAPAWRKSKEVVQIMTNVKVSEILEETKEDHTLDVIREAIRTEMVAESGGYSANLVGVVETPVKTEEIKVKLQPTIEKDSKLVLVAKFVDGRYGLVYGDNSIARLIDEDTLLAGQFQYIMQEPKYRSTWPGTVAKTTRIDDRTDLSWYRVYLEYPTGMSEFRC